MPDRVQWQGRRWTLAILLAGLTMLGPFSIDTYLPAFAGIAKATGATPVQMQQTLSAYLFGFAIMSLFHGALSDSLGRRPVILWAISVFALASVGCALSTSIGELILFRTLQGLSTGAGMVISRAIVRDIYAPADAQRAMSQITLFFAVAPAVAPMVGGVLFTIANWQAIFWFLAFLGLVLWLATYRYLPESLPVAQRQEFSTDNLRRGYWQLGTDPRFLLLAVSSSLPFNGVFIYILAAPAFLGEILGLAPTQFFWFFLSTVIGVMFGAVTSGRLAGRVELRVQVRIGFGIMALMGVINVLANLLFDAQPYWAIAPIAVFMMGWSLATPAITLMVLDLFPERRGMASSMQAFVGSMINAVVAGVIAPLVMHSALGLASASLTMLLIGLLCWRVVRSFWSQTGKRPQTAS